MCVCVWGGNLQFRNHSEISVVALDLIGWQLLESEDVLQDRTRGQVGKHVSEENFSPRVSAL